MNFKYSNRILFFFFLVSTFAPKITFAQWELVPTSSYNLNAILYDDQNQYFIAGDSSFLIFETSRVSFEGFDTLNQKFSNYNEIYFGSVKGIYTILGDSSFLHVGRNYGQDAEALTVKQKQNFMRYSVVKANPDFHVKFLLDSIILSAISDGSIIREFQGSLTIPDSIIPASDIAFSRENNGFIVANKKVYTIDIDSSEIIISLISTFTDSVVDIGIMARPSFLNGQIQNYYLTDTLLVLTEKKLYKSENGGSSFEEILEVVSDEKFKKMHIQPLNYRWICDDFDGGIAIVSSSTVYTSNNFGHSWQVDNSFKSNLKGKLNDVHWCYSYSSYLALVGDSGTFVRKRNSTLGLDRIIENELLTLYPNPSNGIFHFNSKEQISSLVLYNLNGQLLEKLKLENSNMGSFEFRKSGVFILKIKFQNGDSFNSKLIIF